MHPNKKKLKKKWTVECYEFVSAMSKVDFWVVSPILTARVSQLHLRLVPAQKAKDHRGRIDLIDQLVFAHWGVFFLDLVIALAQLLLHHDLVLVFGWHVRVCSAEGSYVSHALFGVCLVWIVTSDELGYFTSLHLTYKWFRMLIESLRELNGDYR